MSINDTTVFLFNSSLVVDTYPRGLLSKKYTFSSLPKITPSISILSFLLTFVPRLFTITPLTLEELTWGDGETVEGDTGGQGSEEFSYNHFDIKVLKTFTYVKDGVSETVTGTMTVNSPVEIKNNGRTTEVKMSSKAQNDETGKYLEYTSLRSQRLEVTNKSIVKITGTVTYTKDGDTYDRNFINREIELMGKS